MVLASARTHTHTVWKQQNEISFWPSSKVTSRIWDVITPWRSKMLEFPFEMSAEMHRWAHKYTVCSTSMLPMEGCVSHFTNCIIMVLTSGSQIWRHQEKQNDKGDRKSENLYFCNTNLYGYLLFFCLSSFWIAEHNPILRPVKTIKINQSGENKMTYNKETFATWQVPWLDIAKFWRVSLAILDSFFLLSTNPLKQPNPQFSQKKNIKHHTGREISL